MNGEFRDIALCVQVMTPSLHAVYRRTRGAPGHLIRQKTSHPSRGRTPHMPVACGGFS